MEPIEIAVAAVAALFLGGMILLLRWVNKSEDDIEKDEGEKLQ